MPTSGIEVGSKGGIFRSFAAWFINNRHYFFPFSDLSETSFRKLPIQACWMFSIIPTSWSRRKATQRSRGIRMVVTIMFFMLGILFGSIPNQSRLFSGIPGVAWFLWPTQCNITTDTPCRFQANIPHIRNCFSSPRLTFSLLFFSWPCSFQKWLMFLNLTHTIIPKYHNVNKKMHYFTLKNMIYVSRKADICQF